MFHLFIEKYFGAKKKKKKTKKGKRKKEVIEKKRSRGKGKEWENIKQAKQK